MTMTSLSTLTAPAYVGSVDQSRWWPTNLPEGQDFQPSLAAVGGAVAAVVSPWSGTLTPGPLCLAQVRGPAKGGDPAAIDLDATERDVRSTRAQLIAGRAQIESLESKLAWLQAGITEITTVRRHSIGTVAVDTGLGTTDFWRKVADLGVGCQPSRTSTKIL